MTTVEQIADAILYEGYILYPYRASALKNGQRWNFGVLYPPSYAAAQRGSDASTMQCECLAARSGNLSIMIRFLQLVTRESWQEAMAREIRMDAPGTHPFSFPSGEDRDASGIVRRQEQIEGSVELKIQPAQEGWSRVSVRISNCGAFDVPETDSGAWPARAGALRRSLVSTHMILRSPDGEFASQPIRRRNCGKRRLNV